MEDNNFYRQDTTDYVSQFREKLPEDMDPALKSQWSRYFLKSDSKAVGLGMILLFGMVILITSIYIALSSVEMSERADEILNFFISLFYTSVPFFIAAAVSKRKKSAMIGLTRPHKHTFWPVLLMALGLMPACQILSVIFDSFLTRFGLGVPQEMLEATFGLSSDPVGAVFQVLTTVLVAGVMEEIVFRGIVMGMLSRYGKWFSIVMSALVFGLIHGNTYQIPFAFMYGLVLGAAVTYTGSLWTGIALHMLNNGISMASQILAHFTQQQLEPQIGVEAAAEKAMYLSNGVTYMAWAVFGILALAGVAMFAARRKAGHFVLKESDYKIEGRMNGSASRIFLSTGTVIAGVIIFVVYALLQTEIVLSFFAMA